jgi:hypothetical protein
VVAARMIPRFGIEAIHLDQQLVDVCSRSSLPPMPPIPWTVRSRRSRR